MEQGDKRNMERLNAMDKRLEERFIAMDRQTSLALSMSDKAITKAENATDRRLDLLQEMRDMVTSQQGAFMLKDSYEMRHLELQRQISFNTTRLDRLDGMTTGLAILGAIITILTVVDLISRFIKP